MESFTEREETRNMLLAKIKGLKRKFPDGEIKLTMPETSVILYCDQRSVRRRIKEKFISARKIGGETDG